MFGPSPILPATSASADFCPITLAHCCAGRCVGYGSTARFARWDRQPSPAPGPLSTSRPGWYIRHCRHRLVGQISPNKNMSFPCTTAAFTLSAVTLGLRDQVPTRPRTRPSMRFLFVGSHVCTWASSRQSLTGLPLPSASGYPDDIGPSHRGLSPHKLMPMSGVHPSFHPTCYGLHPPHAGELKGSAP